MFKNVQKLFAYIIATTFFCVLSVQMVAGSGSQILWKVSQNGHYAYILGSVHFLKKENYPLPQKLYDAFEDCETLVLEADLDSLKMPQTAMKMMQISMLPENKSFKDVVPEETYETVAAHLQKLGLSMQLFARSKPWFIALTITAMEAQKMGLDANLGLDAHFAARAKAQGMALTGLEPIAFQMNLFDQLPLKTQIEFLHKTMEDSQKAEKMMDEMLTAWENGEDQQLQSLLSDGFEGFPKLYDKLLIARNKNWVPQIEKMITSGKTHFIVVGAGHLVGDQGVIDLLQKRGFEIDKL